MYKSYTQIFAFHWSTQMKNLLEIFVIYSPIQRELSPLPCSLPLPISLVTKWPSPPHSSVQRNERCNLSCGNRGCNNRGSSVNKTANRDENHEVRKIRCYLVYCSLHIVDSNIRGTVNWFLSTPDEYTSYSWHTREKRSRLDEDRPVNRFFRPRFTRVNVVYGLLIIARSRSTDSSFGPDRIDPWAICRTVIVTDTTDTK